MHTVLTSVDLQDVAAGEELVLAPDALVTALAREEAARRGITLRVAATPPGTNDVREGVAHAAPWVVAAPDDSIPRATGDPGLIRAVTEEVIAYLIGPVGSQLSAESAGERRTPDPRPTVAAVAALIDHTLLKPDASHSDIEQLCREAAHFGFAAVCVNPWYVSLAARLLHGSLVKVCTVVGFPLGATFSGIKLHEAEEAIKLGAQEIDVVQNVGALKSGDDDQVEADLRSVVDITHRAGAVCKVILETCLLSRKEKVRAALLAKRAGADFVKTSTGFASGGATVEDVALLRETIGSEMGIKASGGIRTLGDFDAMVRAGATRIGTSSGVKIVGEALERARVETPPWPSGSPIEGLGAGE